MDRLRNGQRVGRCSGVVVRLVGIGRRQIALVPEQVERCCDVQITPAGERVAPDRALGAAARGVRVGRRALEDPLDLRRRQRRVDAEQERGGRGDLRGRERRADPVPELARAAVGVRHPGAARDRVVDEIARNRREDRPARGGEVDVLGIAVGVGGHGAVLADRADAEDVRQRRRVVRVGPRRLRRLRAVPDGRDDEDALRVGVLDRCLLGGRVGVELGVARIADAADRQVDHAGALVCRPADRLDLATGRDVAVVVDDLGDQELRVEGDAGDADAVRRVRGNLARDERPVPAGVDAPGALHVGDAAGDPPDELGVARIDPGVDHGDLHRRELGLGRPMRPGVVLAQVPLLRGVRLGVRERERARGDEQPGEGDEDEMLFHGRTHTVCDGMPRRARLRACPPRP